MTSNLTREEIVGRRDNAVRQIHELEHAPISNASAIADYRFDIALCDLALKLPVAEKMLEQFYLRAKEIEDVSRLPVDGPRPIQLVRHVIEQYENVWQRMNTAAQAAATGGG